MKRPLWIVGCVLAGTCAQQLHAQGQPVQQAPAQRVCPVSDDRFKKAQEIFARIAEVLRHPRCINCHGAEDPFAKNTNHSGGTYDVARDEDGNADDEKTFGECQNCHSDFKGWITPPPGIFFVNLDNTGLCMLLKTIAPKLLIGHFENDEGPNNPQFIAEGFKGTRGGAGDAPEPIVGVTQAQLTQLVRDWIGALGSGNGKIGDGDNKPSTDCGCVQHHYAIRGLYSANFSTGPVVQAQELAIMGPTDIPIAIHDDRLTFEGEGTLPFAAGGFVNAAGKAFCTAQSQGGMRVKVSGKIIEDRDQVMLELRNVSPLTGTTGERCSVPYFGAIDYAGALKGGDPAALGFLLDDRIGAQKDAPFPLPAPGMVAKVRVMIVELATPPASSK